MRTGALLLGGVEEALPPSFTCEGTARRIRRHIPSDFVNSIASIVCDEPGVQICFASLWSPVFIPVGMDPCAMTRVFIPTKSASWCMCATARPAWIVAF